MEEIFLRIRKVLMMFFFWIILEFVSNFMIGLVKIIMLLFMESKIVMWVLFIFCMWVWFGIMVKIEKYV